LLEIKLQLIFIVWGYVPVKVNKELTRVFVETVNIPKTLLLTPK